MPNLFSKTEYRVDTLMSYIETGQIGLPRLQRAFIWRNSKVRDLFDSMYRGYPVGNLMLWKENVNAANRTIDNDTNNQNPSLLILDGQQRLTSLYAVMKGKPVIREDSSLDNIKIAFNPLTETFKVADASTDKNRFFINNISDYFTNKKGNYEYITQFLSELHVYHNVSDLESQKISGALTALWSLNSFSFTAIELVSDIEEEEAAEIFVRVNSKGTVLNQADFILTLMSVHWDEGRKKLETFCSEAGKVTGNPHNYFLIPKPVQMLRVEVGFAFLRARLKYVYQLLKGKNLDTGEYSVQNREAQFACLMDAQTKTLNNQTWHDFLHCISVSGYLSNAMISSENTLLYCYALYLIGKHRYMVANHPLMESISQWFFMASITKRYTSSPESQFEKDISLLPEEETPGTFIEALKNACDIELTNDFWEIRLPNELNTTNTISPAFNAFQAALVLLDANALFSDIKISVLINPATRSNRMIEKHHLFPKAYLDSIGITSDNDKNQVANLALTWWSDNMDISDSAPAAYIPALVKYIDRRSSSLHALHDDWYQLTYHDFLSQRRKLMAGVVRMAYLKLTDNDFEDKYPSWNY